MRSVTPLLKSNDDDDDDVVLFGSVPGLQELTAQGIAHETEWDLWKNILALGVIAVGLLVIAYIQLRRIKKLK